MKLGFFEDLKQYIISNEEEHLATLIPYYETMLQHKDKLVEILSHYDKYYMEIHYLECNEDDYYTDGTILLSFYEKPFKHGYQKDIGYSYKIELLYDDRMWGYCDCEPDDEGYDEKHHCCGNGCDYIFPEIRIEKVSNVTSASFEGSAKDLWELEAKWDIYLQEHNEQVKQRELERLEESIRELEQRKLKLLNT